MPTESMADDAAPPTAVAAPNEEPELHRGLRRRADRAGPDRPADRRDHGGHADRDRPVEVPGRVPGALRRRRDRRAALRGARDGPRDGRHAAGRRALLDVPPAGLRPDRPRRLPERPAGPARGRPRRARRRGRDEPPGDVHAAGPAPAAEPRDRVARRTSRSCGRCSARRSPRTTRSRSTTRATPGFGLPPVEPERSCRSGGARSCARAATSSSSGSARSSPARVEAADALAGDGWSVGVDQRPLREAARSRADPRPGARQAARRDVRGERRDRRVRVRRPRGDRGGPARRRRRCATSRVRIIGIPGDRFVDHGSVADLRRMLRLDAAGPRRPGARDARRRSARGARGAGESGPWPRRLAAPALVSRGEAGCATIGG